MDTFDNDNLKAERHTIQPGNSTNAQRLQRKEYVQACVGRAELASNLDHVNAILRDGALRARAVAEAVLHRARTACGLG